MITERKIKHKDEKQDTFIREWAKARFTTSVFNFTYSSMSSLVTADFALRRARDRSRAKVGGLSATRLDEGISTGSITSTDGRRLFGRRTNHNIVRCGLRGRICSSFFSKTNWSSVLLLHHPLQLFLVQLGSGHPCSKGNFLKTLSKAEYAQIT
jgi:hypothetical protein